VVLIDFGLARDVRHAPGVSLLGSPLYMPPEMLAYEPHSFPADIWSFGMLLTEMALGRPMLVGSAMRAMLDTATRAIDLSKLEGHCSERMLSMVRDSLVFDQALRPTSLDLRRHPWLKESASQAEFAKYLGRVYRRDWWGRVKSTLCCGAAPNQNQQQSNQKK
jgi:serine/threonine protein kinase